MRLNNQVLTVKQFRLQQCWHLIGCLRITVGEEVVRNEGGGIELTLYRPRFRKNNAKTTFFNSTRARLGVQRLYAEFHVSFWSVCSLSQVYGYEEVEMWASLDIPANRLACLIIIR